MSCAVTGNVFADNGCLELTPVTTAACKPLGNETVCWNPAGQVVSATPNGLSFLYNTSVLAPGNLPLVAGMPTTCGGDALFWNASYDQYGRLENCSVGPSTPMLITTPISGIGISGTGPSINLVAIPGLPANWTLNCGSSGTPFLTGDQYGRVHSESCVNSSAPILLANSTVFAAVAQETTLVVSYGVNATTGT